MTSHADSEAPKPSLRTQIARGAGWMVLFRIADRSIGLVSTVVLARLLIPSDFGIVAMSVSLIALIELFTAFSLSVALIQNPNPPRHLYDTAWTLNLSLMLSCALIAAALAYPAAQFFREPRLTEVILVLSLAWAIEGAENIGIVQFRREMNFSREFSFMAYRRIAAFVVTIVLAFWWRNYWALVCGMLTQRLAGLILSFTMHPFRPRLSLRGCRELFSFSSWLLLNNFFHFLHLRLGHFLIGRMLGSAPLGIYTMGSDLATFVTHDFIAPVNRAVFPGLSRMAERVSELKGGFLDIAGMLATLIFPAALGMAAVARPVVLLALGPNWVEAAPIVGVLALAGIFNGLNSHNYSVYLALGRTALSTMATSVGVILLVPLMLLLGAEYGLLGVAYALVAAAAAGLIASCLLLFGKLQLAVSEYLARIIRPLTAATSMAIAVHFMGSSEALEDMAPPLQLAILVPLGALMYVVVMAALWAIAGRPQGAETMLLSRVRNFRVSPGIAAASRSGP